MRQSSQHEQQQHQRGPCGTRYCINDNAIASVTDSAALVGSSSVSIAIITMSAYAYAAATASQVLPRQQLLQFQLQRQGRRCVCPLQQS